MSTITGTDYGRAQRRGLDAAWSPALVNVHNLYRSANQNQLRALAAIPKPFDKAQRALRLQGEYQTGQIKDQAEQQLAGAQQDAISSGMFQTTAYDAMNRQIRGVRARSLDELDASIAEQSANLKLAQGQAVANQRTLMAGTKFNYLQAQAALASKRSNQYAAILYGKQGGLIGPIAQLAGLAGGVAAGTDWSTKKTPTKSPNDYSLQE